MNMISGEEFKALDFDEQKDYLINVIKNFSDEKKTELLMRMIQEGLLEVDEDGNVSG